MKTFRKATNTPGLILHGECVVFPSTIPATAKIKQVKGPYLVVADSETTGNHHVVDILEDMDIIFYEEGDKTFMKNSGPTNIRCLHENRHDTVVIQPGVWEFGAQQEYDYFMESLRAVRD